MKAADHIRIARALSCAYDLQGRKKGAFVLGSILPDINLFSYLTLSRQNRLRGHSYTFKKTKMQRHMNRPQTYSTLWWFRTGILCHYLADSFTGSHDERRKMCLSCHRQYENRLHHLFDRHWHTLQSRPVSRKEPVSETVAAMRREYDLAKKGIETDCRMILEAVHRVIGAMAAKE